jgi:demethylmenaquinone methyltransferase/2-methoxy-6-polyprenyl-1,4-benzoquinol methylase
MAPSQDTDRRPLQAMFERVPDRYDRINRLFTFRLDERWRNRAASICLRRSPARVLDLACGTGDLALQLARLAPPTTELIGLDFSEPMLEVARRKAAEAGLAERVPFVWGDARALPFPDGHFDAIGIAFAFRNLTWKNPLTERYLAEVLRVLAPGGRFVVVESSQPRWGVLRALTHWYQTAIVSPLGGFLSGQPGAYRYLALSAKNYFEPDQVARLLLDTGFAQVSWQRLLGGVAAIHLATKAESVQP